MHWLSRHSGVLAAHVHVPEDLDWLHDQYPEGNYDAMQAEPAAHRVRSEAGGHQRGKEHDNDSQQAHD